MSDCKVQTKPKSKPLYEILPDGRWDFYIDHSGLKDFRMCEQYYKYRHIDLIKPRGSGSLAMNVGSWWSDTLEKTYQYLIGHLLVSKPEFLAIGASAWADLKMDSFETSDAKHYKAFGGRDGAIVMLSQYYDSHLVNDEKNWKIIAVEAGFGLKGECLVGENDKVVVHWVGKPDLLVLDGHRLCPLDHKTRTRIDPDTHARYKPHPQTAGYIFATRIIAASLEVDALVDRCIINVCARTEPAEKPRNGGPKRPRFVRVLVGYSPSELEEWRIQTLAKVTRFREAIESGIFLWSEDRCHDMYFRPCPYRGLCSAPPGAPREAFINGNFDKVERWVPYEVQEDESE